MVCPAAGKSDHGGGFRAFASAEEGDFVPEPGVAQLTQGWTAGGPPQFLHRSAVALKASARIKLIGIRQLNSTTRQLPCISSVVGNSGSHGSICEPLPPRYPPYFHALPEDWIVGDNLLGPDRLRRGGGLNGPLLAQAFGETHDKPLRDHAPSRCCHLVRTERRCMSGIACQLAAL